MNPTISSRGLRIAVLWVALSSQVCLAQTETPEQVAGQLRVAVRDGSWDHVAGLMHPAALHDLRAVLEPLVTMDGPAGDSLRWYVFGSAALDSTAVPSDSAVFVGLMRLSLNMQGPAARAVQPGQYRPLGTVYEGHDTVHVLGRMSMIVLDHPTNQMLVTSLVRSGPTWRGLLQADWSMFAWAIRGTATRAKRRAGT